MLPEKLENVFSTNIVIDAEGNERPLGGNISRGEAIELSEIVGGLKPRQSLEIGLARGISAASILAGLQICGGHHYVIDPFQKDYGYVGTTFLNASGYAGRFTFYEKFAEEVVPSLPPLQFAFIDSSHLFDLTITEFVLIDRKLEIGGVLALHDTWMPAIRSAIRFILTNRRYEIVPLRSPKQPVSRRAKLRSVCGRVLARVPGADHVFGGELLNVYPELDEHNLIFLKKLAADQRPWTFHKPF